ncbi:hypothetical protein [Phenylobacterium sp.]|uniref:hypothetical protein n=1 Tax=Phenylobacterium sp. TaxID=1871053 RepID=UPI002BF54655|nr:hypothetical protein [Phenylobacterium sp.]HLZ73845.1 hypothetical protein [Phenylobacterium sp.]
MVAGSTSAAHYCSTALSWAYDFQTLISGILAILAALGTAAVVLRAARLPIEASAQREQAADDRKRRYLCSILAECCRRVGSRARQAEGTITVVIAANSTVNDAIRAKVALGIDAVADDVELMALLPGAVMPRWIAFRRVIDDHNFDMNRAGGAFGDENFRRSIRDRLVRIGTEAAALAAVLSAEAGATAA